MVGDSHLKSLNLRMVEKVTGGRLFTPWVTRPKEDRAYCSTRSWPNAKFPNNNLTEKVPELHRARTYSNMIIQAPCNNIFNLSVMPQAGNKEEMYWLVEQSSRNTIKVVVDALKEFPSLHKLILMERLARVDSLSAVSDYSNFVIRLLAAKSEFKDNIVFGSHSLLECDTDAKTVNMFGPSSSPRSDGIHLRGHHGMQLHTDSVILIVKTAGIPDTNAWRQQRHSGSMVQASTHQPGHRHHQQL